MIRQGKLIIILVTVCLLLVSCNSQYADSVSAFKNLYFKTADSIMSSDLQTSAKNLNSSENENNIETMRKLLEQLKNNAPGNSSDEIKQLTNWYNGIVFLHDSYNRWDSLTFDDKERIFNEMVLMRNRSHHKTQ